jgi:hypothetical protein
MTTTYPNQEVLNNHNNIDIKDTAICHLNFDLTPEEKNEAIKWFKQEFEARFTFAELKP